MFSDERILEDAFENYAIKIKNEDNQIRIPVDNRCQGGGLYASSAATIMGRENCPLYFFQDARYCQVGRQRRCEMLPSVGEGFSQ